MITMTMRIDNLALAQDTTSGRLACSLGTDEVWTAIDMTRTPRFLEMISPVFSCMISKVRLATCRYQVQIRLTRDRTSTATKPTFGKPRSFQTNPSTISVKRRATSILPKWSPRRNRGWIPSVARFHQAVAIQWWQSEQMATTVYS